MTDGMALHLQLRRVFEQEQRLATQISVALGHHRSYVYQCLRRPPPLWQTAQAIAAGTDATFLLIPINMVERVKEILAQDAPKQYGLTTPAGVVARLIAMITDEVTAKVYAELAIQPPPDDDEPDNEPDDQPDEDEPDEDEEPTLMPAPTRRKPATRRKPT